jgi:hypothetical protein
MNKCNGDIWLVPSGNDNEGSMLGLVLNSAGSLSVVSSSDGGPAIPYRKHGRPRKMETPKMDNVACRDTHNTRNNNDVFVHPGLPDTRHHASSVPRSLNPPVLQIAEVQHLGVEYFHVDPKYLTEVRLVQDCSE